MANPPIYLQLFGTLCVRCGDRTIDSFGTDKNAELLAYLAHYRTTPHRREILAEMLWPTEDDVPHDHNPRHNLNQALHSLRRRFDDHGIPHSDLLLSTRQNLQINPDSCTTDVAEFEAHLAAAGKAAPSERLSPLKRAIQLSELEFQTGCYSDWAGEERHRLAALREDAVQQLHVLEGREGRSSTHPEATGAPTGPTASASAPVATTLPRLPRSRTRFFGRDEEAREIERWLRDPEVRLVNLTGMGGIGKTRLALHVGQLVRDRFHEDITFVSLASLQQGREIPTAILYALGLHESEPIPPLDRIVTRLQGRPTLLILDNFEQLAERGASAIGLLLDRLPELTVLVTSRQVLHLAGEQEFPVSALPLPASGTPPDVLVRNPSVALLRDRIRQRRPGFEVTKANSEAVVLLCRKLEGVPLSIELAAGHGRDRTPAQMLQMLAGGFATLESRRRDQEPRHHSLWAVLEGSYRALTPDMQGFFARLSVFEDGWTKEAAAALATEQTATLYLNHLMERSLILSEERGETMRFRMLEVVREFAKERLSPGEQAELSQEHARYFLQFAAQAQPQLAGAEERPWLERIEADRANLYLALERALPDDPSRATLHLTNCLGHFWFTRGHLSDGRAILARLLPKAAHPLPRARVLNILGAFAGVQGDEVEAERAYRECLELAEIGNDPGVKANALGNLGLLAWNRMDYAAARRYYEASLPVDMALELPHNVFITRVNLSLVACREGQFAEAKSLLALNLDQARESKDSQAVAWTLGNLAQVARHEGDLDLSEALCRESLALLEETKNEVQLATLLEELAYLLQRRGDYERCLRLIGIANETRRRHGSPLAPVDRIDYDACLSAVQQELPAEVFRKLLEAGTTTPVEDAVATILRGNPDP